MTNITRAQYEALAAKQTAEAITGPKLPEWPTLHNTFAAELADAEIAYWESRCRLLYAAIKSVEAVFDGEDYEVLGFLNIAETALRDCGPLPEDTP